MSLLLSSNGAFAIDQIRKLVKKPANQIKIAWITTASKGGVLSQEYLKLHKEQMENIGYSFARIDIEARNEEQLKDIAQENDMIFIEGGNVFYLLRAIRQTGFDKILKKFIDEGKLYVGASAGAYIMCPTIEMGSWKHPERPRYELTDLTSLNYVPFLIFAHYLPEHKELIENKIKTTEFPLRVIQDNQGFLVDKGNVEFVGQGKEIKMN